MSGKTGFGNGLAIAVLASIAMLIVPLPPLLLDLLLAFDIMFATAILVVALSIQNPLELAAFPSLLLVTTLFRLSLDVSASRLILTQGEIPGAVGTVIPAFGSFVMRGSAVVGVLLFVILIVVQLVVVTNGAQRVAEVAARFTLDALPGKQMAIDADLHSGLIDAVQARLRRKAVQAEADFYGAMDGAGKFVRGDAIAAIVIVVVNVVAGIGIGILSKHLDLAGATQIFTVLSIGNALATTLPAFLLSTAMGIMVTRAASDVALGTDLVHQLLAHPQALRTVGVSMLALSIVPGLPHLAFGTLGVGAVAAAALCVRLSRRDEALRRAEELERQRAETQKPENAIGLLGIDVLSIELGERLLPLLEAPANATVLQRISLLRRAIALDLGIVLPPVRIQDNLRLPAQAFAIRVRDRIVTQGTLHADRALALGTPNALDTLHGSTVVAPGAQQSAKWIPSENTAHDERLVVVDPLAALTSALANAVRGNAAALLGRQETQMLLDHLRQTHPASVKGVVPELIGLGLVQRVLQHLVREAVPIRDIASIVECIADESEETRDASVIGEAVRRRLSATVCSRLADADNLIRAVALDMRLESQLAAATVLTERGPSLGLEPMIASSLARKLEHVAQSDHATIVCSQSLRLPLARFAEALGLRLSVLGLAEVVPGYTINVVETIPAD